MQRSIASRASAEGLAESCRSSPCMTNVIDVDAPPNACNAVGISTSVDLMLNAEIDSRVHAASVCGG